MTCIMYVCTNMMRHYTYNYVEKVTNNSTFAQAQVHVYVYVHVDVLATLLQSVQTRFCLKNDL